jgi:predicted ATPase
MGSTLPDRAGASTESTSAPTGSHSLPWRAETRMQPKPLTSFVGREHEREMVQDLLRRPDVYLLTLTGPGGVGKTRLALRAVEDARDVVEDGGVFVPLAPVRDPDLVLPTVAKALGVPDAPDQPLLSRVQAFLRDRSLMLVLDNFEHVLPAAPLVIDLLARSARLTVLCTSRNRLGVSGEWVVPLGALDPEAAVALFTERAFAVAPSFALTDDTSPIIESICTRLDGLPLAIELAAARIAVLPPKALLTRLDHRLELLTGGPRDAPARLRGMRDAIAWSHELLPEPEQALFRRLGAFVGGFTLDGAEAVAGDGEDVLDGVASLVESSLVQVAVVVEGEPRYLMLETIREYALEQLAVGGDEGTIRSAHVRHFLALAEQMWASTTGLELEGWLQRLRPETGNFREALT